MDLELTRRKFLQILGIAPVAGVALNLPAAMVAVPEPTIERVTNYISDPKVVGDGVLHLEVISWENVEAIYPHTWGFNCTGKIVKRYEPRSVEVTLTHAYHPLMSVAWNDRQLTAITFNTHHEHVLLVGYIARLNTTICGYDEITQTTTIVLDEPIVTKPL